MTSKASSQLELNPELFVVPSWDSNFFLYTPLQGSILKVNGGAIRSLKSFKDGSELEESIKQEFVKHGILVSKSDVKEEKVHECEQEYKPTSVTLIPTLNCNLRCVYCYSEAGEKTGANLDIKTAKAAADIVIDNARKQKKSEVHMGFHGGGEPLLPGNKPFLKEIIDYFRKEAAKYKIKSKVSSATNGVFINRNTLEWILNNFDSLNISLDGPRDIQEAQRPLAGGSVKGKTSFDYVLRTIKEMEDRKFSYGIRATITQDSVHRMPEIIKFFRSISSLKQFHLEPLFECGRCKTSKVKAPDSKEFLKYVLLAKETAKELGVSVYYSGAKLEDIQNTFCGAAGSNFFVTPSGRVTTCLEVSRESDNLSNIFLIGKYDETAKTFKFDRDKIKRLKQRKVESIPGCKNCFAKYNCAGDCLAKVYRQTGSLVDTTENKRCVINRGLLLKEMQDKTNLPYSKNERRQV